MVFWHPVSRKRLSLGIIVDKPEQVKLLSGQPEFLFFEKRIRKLTGNRKRL